MHKQDRHSGLITLFQLHFYFWRATGPTMGLPKTLPFPGLSRQNR